MQNSQQEPRLNSDKEIINTATVEQTIKQIQQKYESYESLLKQERDHEYQRVLNDLMVEIEAIQNRIITDPQHIYMLLCQYLPKFMKIILNRKYILSEQPIQLIVTKFVNQWIKLRVPCLADEFAAPKQEDQRDPIHQSGAIGKELEIIEWILDDNSDIYNHRVSKNNVDTEERLSRIMEDINSDGNNQMEDDFTQFKQYQHEVAFVKKPQSTSYFYVHNINVFSKYGGFDLLLRILSCGQRETHKVNFKQYLGVLNILNIMKQNLRDVFWLEYAPQIKDMCLDYIRKKCTQEDLRNISKRDLTYFVNNLESILDSVVANNDEKTDKVYFYSENLELELALRCLKLPILEKKLIGNSIIMNKIYQARNNSIQPLKTQQQQQRNISLNIQKRWLNVNRLIEWMDQHSIFDLVFGESLHSEVITKSNTLLQFLYQNGRIRNKEIDKMWECATKKHEAYKVAILKTFQFLATKASRDDLQYLFDKLKSLPMAEVDKFCIALIKAIAKKLAGDEDKHEDQYISAQRPSTIARSNSFSKGTKARPNLKITVGQSNNRNSDQAAAKFDHEQGASNFEGLHFYGTKETQYYDDLSIPFGGQSKNKTKKTRSLSLGEDTDIKKGQGSFPDIYRDGNELNVLQDVNMVNFEEEKIVPKRAPQQPNQIFETNPLEVPADKEDKKTADEEGSFGDREDTNMNFNEGSNDIFDNQIRDFQPSTNIPAMNAQRLAENQSKDPPLRNQKRNTPDLEEEKVQPSASGSQETILMNLNDMINDQNLGIENPEVRDLATQVLNYMWHLCMEETVTEEHLSVQTHKLCIDSFVQLVTQSYPKAVLHFIAKCVNSLTQNYSVISVQTMLHKFLLNIQFPLDSKKTLPKNRIELIQYLDEILSIANTCLGSYIEFKRISLTLIFDQLGSQEQEQENLETQSSLDNDDERSSIQSAQKNNTQTQPGNNNITIQEQIQKEAHHVEEINTQQSSGSLFVSPRGKIEEEFKISGPQKTQSYQSDQIHGFNRTADFTINVRESEPGEEWFQKQNNQQLMLGPHGSQGNNRHFNSQTKRSSQFQTMAKNDNLVQPSSVQANETTPREAAQEQNGNPQQQQQQQHNSNREFLNNLITNDVYKYSYNQEMQFRLDFLKFFIGSSPSILKPQQIQVVWECLVNNAFYEKERDHFFSWCTQILKAAQNLPGAKDIDSIGGASIFKDDCMEMLFFDTLLKLDFRYITETMYECFERYFIYINEQYGQIVTSSAFESAFEVFETKLIGVEALWEITLCSRTDKVYNKAAEFLHKLYKKMSPTLADKLNEIKEDLLQTCMEQIKTGLNEIKQEIGSDLYEVPICQLVTSVEDPKNRIARSISQLCKFIDEFEGLRERGGKGNSGALSENINLVCQNQISSSQGPKKIDLTIPLGTKVSQIREMVASSIFPVRQSKEICLTFKGKDLNEDLKSLKDLGVRPEDQIKMMVTLRNQFELDQHDKMEDLYDDEQLNSLVSQLKEFGFDLPEPVMKLAIKKCNLNLEEALLLLTEEDKLEDLQQELRKQSEKNNQIVIVEEATDDAVKEDSKLNLIISNREEYFEMLFELLNLGINEITNASWNLLVQIPVNKKLLHNIRNLSVVQQGHSQNWCQIIDPSNVYKLLYSLQIVNSLISVNNGELSEAEIQERYEWRARFLELGGFDHLYSILITSDIDELLGFAQQQQILQSKQGTGKKKQKSGQQRTKQGQPQNEVQQKEQHQIQNNSAKCLGYLISIIKIFIQAALLTADEEKIFTIIVQSSTSPFRKIKTMNQLSAVPPSKFNQMILKGSGQSIQGDTSLNEGISRDNSSVNTPKFHSSHSSNNTTPQCQTPNENLPGKDQQNKSVDTAGKAETFSQQTFSKQPNENQLYTQVDDFPRLMDQMKGFIAQNLLEKVINFNGLISKLLHIIFKATMFSDSSEVSQLVQNSLDLLLPCVVWRPNQLLKEIYEFEHLESLLIRTLMYSSNENVRKSLEKTFKTICSEGIIQGTSAQKKHESQDEPHEGSSQVQVESPKLYILKMLLNNMPDVNQKSDQCEEYFNLLTSLIRQCHSNFVIIPRVEPRSAINSSNYKSKIILTENKFSSIELLEWCIFQLQSRPTYEDKYSNYTDKVLGGYLQLTQSVLEIETELKKATISEQGGNNLVKIIFDFLFLLPSMEDQQSKHLRQGDKTSHMPAMLSSIDSHPKCKRKFTRKKAFNLLLTLCHQCKENYVQLLQELYVFQSQIQKSQKVVNLAEFDTEVGMRSATGYVGLKNFACTCYMNSLIQQLFMIPDLRKGILQSEFENPNQENNVLYQLKMIFANLQESEKQYYSPLGFTQAFKFYGEPVNVRVQMDTHEFYNILCDEIENSLKGTQFSELLKDTIGGVIGNETKSLEKEYPYVGEREEQFFAISLDIKNKKNLAEALDLYIKPDFLEGDNKYHCEKYDTKVNAQRRSYLKKLSNTVIINLKRFEFDYNNMQKIKINDYCEFPTQINFKPWTKEGIKEREKQLVQSGANNNVGNGNGVINEENQHEEAEEEDINDDNELSGAGESDPEELKIGGEAIDEDMEDEDDLNVNTGTYFDDGMEDMIDIEEDSQQASKKRMAKSQSDITTSKVRNAPNNERVAKETKPSKLKKSIDNKDDRYYQYELVGVLVHSGSADSGHYYSFIKERGNQRWLEFNDKIVREFDIKNLETECFGGNNDNRSNLPAPGLLDDFNPADGRLFERCRNAYLLFYERVQPIPNKDQQQVLQNNQKLINGIDNKMYQRIWEENAAFMKLKIFFDQEYFQFVREYVTLCSFDNVAQFSPEHSESQRIKEMSRLSSQYNSDPGHQLQDYRMKYLEIQREGDLSRENDIFLDINDVTTDPGLYTIKLATILSQDIITKVKDVQNFVQWMQLINLLYERHAVACVWFIKYMTGNRKILEELLLESLQYEVRESFSTLLNTAISVTAKNEESYFFEYDTVYDFDCDEQLIQLGQIEQLKYSKSSVIRFMDLLFGQMLDTARIHWRRFEEYFIVLTHFVQLGYPETQYMIDQKAIGRVLEFAMNSQAPFYSTTKFKMGDRMQEPNFMHCIDLLSLLVRSCFTQGVQNVGEYSAHSRFQEESQHIPLPQDEIKYLLNIHSFTYELLPKAPHNNDSLKNMVEYLCWGDFQNSRFFIEEIIEQIKVKKHSINDIVNHFKILGGILSLKDEFQETRLRMAMNFDNFQMKDLGIFSHIYNIRQNFALYVLKILQFFGELAISNQPIMSFMRSNQSYFKEWVSKFLLGVRSQAQAHHEAQAYQINLKQILQSTINTYSIILDNDELIQSAQTEKMNVEPMQDQDSFDGRNKGEVIETDTNKQFDFDTEFGVNMNLDPPHVDKNVMLDEFEGSFNVDDNEDKQLIDLMGDTQDEGKKRSDSIFNDNEVGQPWEVNDPDDRI